MWGYVATHIFFTLDEIPDAIMCDWTLIHDEEISSSGEIKENREVAQIIISLQPNYPQGNLAQLA